MLYFQSNGYSSDNQKEPDSYYCYKNYDEKHGPGVLNFFNSKIPDYISYKTWSLTDYGVVRILANISGKWKALIRCNEATTDAIQLELNFPASTGGAFTATGSGTDYTGDPIQVVINGNYDATKNVLTGTIKYTFPNNPNYQREDSFSSSLNFDNTPYTALIKVIDNGGCKVLISLVNLQRKNAVSYANKILVKSIINKPNCKSSIGRSNY